MSDVNVSTLCTNDESRSDDAFENQMGSSEQKFPILKRSRLTFIGIANDISDRSIFLLCILLNGPPFLGCPGSGTSLSNQAGIFECLQYRFPESIPIGSLQKIVE